MSSKTPKRSQRCLRDEYLRDLDRMIVEIMTIRDELTPAIGNGSASLDLVKTIAKEYYYLGKWMTPEFALLIANAPDAYPLTMDDSEHYAHWAQNFADEAGYLGDPNHVEMKWEWCQQLGISADELTRYVPLPETVATTFTMLYYIRRSYEEGLRSLASREKGWRAQLDMPKPCTRAEAALRPRVRNFEVHAYAEPDHGDKAEALFRKVVQTATIQRRCREAIRNVMLVREARTKALNRLVK